MAPGRKMIYQIAISFSFIPYIVDLAIFIATKLTHRIVPVLERLQKQIFATSRCHPI